MPSSDMLREVLGLVNARRDHTLQDLAQVLSQRSGQTWHDLGFRTLEAVTTLVRWGLVEVRDGGLRQRLDQVEKILPSDGLDRVELRISPAAAELESTLGLRLDGSLPVFGIPSKKPAEKPLLFVVMPFATELDPVRDVIHAVGTAQGLRVERGDDAFTANEVMKDVWSSIYSARLVVADCTGRNPNVFYEIGLAHAVGRPTILLARTIDDIPFDLRHRRVIISAATSEGMAKLATRLEETIRGVLATEG